MPFSSTLAEDASLEVQMPPVEPSLATACRRMTVEVWKLSAVTASFS